MASERRADRWQEDLKLDGEPISRVNNFKYLGVEFNQDYDDKIHIRKRMRATQAGLAKLRSLEILSGRTGPYIKGHLFKTYLMPVLYYGLETIKPTKTNLNLIKRFESKIIRSIYGIRRTCRTTNLRLKNNLNDTVIKLRIIQIDFLERLLINDFTKELFKGLLLKEAQEDYVSNVLNILNELYYKENLSLIDKCKYYKYVSNLEFETVRKNNTTLEQLRVIFGQNNGNSAKLYKLLRFDKN